MLGLLRVPYVSSDLPELSAASHAPRRRPRGTRAARSDEEYETDEEGEEEGEGAGDAPAAGVAAAPAADGDEDDLVDDGDMPELSSGQFFCHAVRAVGLPEGPGVPTEVRPAERGLAPVPAACGAAWAAGCARALDACAHWDGATVVVCGPSGVGAARQAPAKPGARALGCARWGASVTRRRQGS